MNGPVGTKLHYFECQVGPKAKLARSLEFVTDDSGDCAAARSLALRRGAGHGRTCYQVLHLGTPVGD